MVARGLSVRQTEAATREGGAPRQRKPRLTLVDPALASRAASAATELTGLPSRVTPDKLEIVFENETQLAELIETLERALD